MFFYLVLLMIQMPLQKKKKQYPSLASNPCQPTILRTKYKMLDCILLAYGHLLKKAGGTEWRIIGVQMYLN